MKKRPDTGEEFFLCEVQPPHVAPRCPLCGNVAELWKRKSFMNSDSFVYAVCCTTHDKNATIDTDDMTCPFWLPPDQYWRATKREAVNFWDKMYNHWGHTRCNNA